MSLVKNVARTIGICLVVAGSLATFPGAVPWMVAVWLVWHTWLTGQGHPGWVPLAACLALLLVKRVPWLPGILICMALMTIAALVGCRRGRVSQSWLSSRSAVLAGLVLIWLSWGGLLWDWTTSAAVGERKRIDPLRPVVCMGDSLTSGIEPEPGYPDHLAKLVTVPVINLGRAGISTREGLKLLAQMAAAKPQAVVIELGGHDFLKGYPRAATKENLRKLIQAARDVGAEPILIEVPRGFMTDPYAGLERELAREEDLELISDTVIRKLVLWSPYAPPGMWTGGPYLSDDGLHPNRAGNDALAAAAARALQHVFGDAVRRRAPPQ